MARFPPSFVAVLLGTVLAACSAPDCCPPPPPCVRVAPPALAPPAPMAVAPIAPPPAGPSVPPPVPTAPPPTVESGPPPEAVALPAPALPPKAPGERVVRLQLSEAALACDGEPLGTLDDANPDEVTKTLETLRERLLTRTAEPETRAEDGRSTYKLHLNASRSTKWKYVQWIMQVCADPRIRIYRMHFQIPPRDAECPDTGEPSGQ